MIRRAIKNTISTNSFYCVELFFQENEKKYHLLEIEKNKADLTICSKRETVDFEALVKGLDKNKPVILALTGKGILTKKVVNSANYRSALLFNANPEDFYWYEYRQDEQLFVSVVRKDLVNAEIEAFEKNKLAVLDLSIGPLVVAALKPLLPDLSTLLTRNIGLAFKGSLLNDLKKHNDLGDENGQIRLGNEKLSPKDTVGFSALLHYLYPYDLIEADNDFLTSKREEFTYRKAFNALGAIALPLFLISLLVSYLLLNNYQSKYMELQVALGEENIAHNKLILLEEDQKNKEAILKESGLNNGNFLSYYVSEITKEIPAEISLTELEVFPSEKKIKQKERVVFKNSLIGFKGNVVSNNAFTAWVQKVKDLEWVENLEIVDFIKNGNTNSFEIRLIVRFDV